jgi:hypothetical protein
MSGCPLDASSGAGMFSPNSRGKCPLVPLLEPDKRDSGRAQCPTTACRATTSPTKGMLAGNRSAHLAAHEFYRLRPPFADSNPRIPGPWRSRQLRSRDARIRNMSRASLLRRSCYACRCTRLCKFCCRKVALTPGMAILSPWPSSSTALPCMSGVIAAANSCTL